MSLMTIFFVLQKKINSFISSASFFEFCPEMLSREFVWMQIVDKNLDNNFLIGIFTTPFHRIRIIRTFPGSNRIIRSYEAQTNQEKLTRRAVRFSAFFKAKGSRSLHGSTAGSLVSKLIRDNSSTTRIINDN